MADVVVAAAGGKRDGFGDDLFEHIGDGMVAKVEAAVE